MDNLTHSLTGILLSRAGLNKLAPSATGLLLIALNAPDIDIVTALGGELAYLEHHRGLTHTFLFSPVMALFPFAFWPLLARGVRKGRLQWVGAYVLSLIGVWVHVLQDWWNVYGIPFARPFTPEWFRLDWVNIIDIWLWVILVVATAAPLLTRLVDSEIGAPRTAGRGWAWFGIIAVAAYLGTRGQLHNAAIHQLSSRIYMGEPPKRVAAFPSEVAPWRWTGLVEGADFYKILPVDLSAELDPDSGRVLHQPPPSDAIQSARATRSAAVFLRFSRFPYWRVIPASEPVGGTKVELTDLRFGLPGEGSFQVTVILDPAGAVVSESFHFREPEKR